MSNSLHSRTKIPASTSDFNPGHSLPGQPFVSRQQDQSPVASPSERELAHMQQLDAGVMQTLGLQAKLAIGAPGDKYEQEADQVATQVVDQINTAPGQAQSVQRQGMPEEEDELQMKPLAASIQRQGMPEEEDELQMKPQAASIQRQGMPEEEDELQMKPQAASPTRSRKLPGAYKAKAKAGDRARTWEETAIDVAGTGSALDSLINSPMQTIGNAFSGLFSGFPSRATIRKQPVVQAAISSAWSAAQSDYAERFGWITWDKNTDTYAVPSTSVGTPYSCTPPPKPADPAPNDPNQVFHVGEFHIHPPLDPSDPAMADPLDWPIGPSQTDETAAQADNSPGIVRDFDSVDRAGGVTDYTYGPWTRTK
ncbi:MAG: hypothetical protein AAFX01_07760 [Cyanobacteria bacterium J06638_28]